MRDFSVPAPKPENLWVFRSGQSRTIAAEPLIVFRVDQIFTDRVTGTQMLDTASISGTLYPDVPAVVIKDKVTDIPVIALTLRRIESGIAYIQVTALNSVERRYRQ
jgi:hypothetical protein